MVCVCVCVLCSVSLLCCHIVLVSLDPVSDES